MLLIIAMIFVVLIASGICSMLEAAILSLPMTRARILLEEKKPFASDVVAIKEDIHTAVATIVILNNGVNIIGSIFVGNMVSELFGSGRLAIFSAVMTFGIIVLSEIIPKTVGEQHKISVSFAGAKPLRTLMWVFRPFIKMIIFLTKPILKGSKRPQITEREIKTMLRIGRSIGTIEVDEETLINRVFKLNDLRAVQMMKPIDKIFALPGDKTLKEVKEHVLEAPYSRIAVYAKESIQHIIGICQHRVLLNEIAKDNYSARVSEYIRKPIFVHENERADNLLEKFRFYNQHLFIVKDRFEKNIGIITMEDVLEELFGEIYDEKDFGQQ